MSVPTIPIRRSPSDPEPGHGSGAGAGRARPAPPSGLPRLLPPATGRPEDLRDHLARHGFPPYRGERRRLIADIEATGLTGRGGAAFPAHRKLTAVADAGGRPFVVANAAESEPASGKDASLLWLAPHLVLDGLQLAAEAVGAQEACLYLHGGPGDRLTTSVQRALAERWGARTDRVAVRLAGAPPRFLAGQETALVSVLNGGLALPAFTPPRVFERGVGGAPTLVQNVETLAHIALIARYGARWFRGVGTREEPGSMLCTIHHTDGGAQVVEAALGTRLSGLLGDSARSAQAVLVGGYHGTWIPAVRAAGLTLDNAGLRPEGATVGAGVIAALPAGRCGLAETARVARYLALESAGQCGPCLNGLPRIADSLAELAGPRPGSRARGDIERWSGLITGRGACHHPDGAARFISSALTVFAAEIGRHKRGTCSATTREPFLPLPPGAPASDEDWS
ncbi:MAG TPA: NADH-ubiquinone oxidoreductase-F iron-sulfur binding region domain-containing protein [Streptosporangiaceae bacterium]